MFVNSAVSIGAYLHFRMGACVGAIIALDVVRPEPRTAHGPSASTIDVVGCQWDQQQLTDRSTLGSQPNCLFLGLGRYFTLDLDLLIVEAKNVVFIRNNVV